MQWCENATNTMGNGEIEARMHAELTTLDGSRSPNESIRSWMFGALEMMRKLKEHPQNDICRYSNGKIDSGVK